LILEIGKPGGRVGLAYDAGHLILRESNLYDTPRALAASLFIVMLALAFDLAGSFIERHRNLLVRAICIPRPIW
jgi:hypothetical protein